MLEALLPPVCEDPVQWLQDHITLPESVSANKPGRLDLCGQPWMAEILRAYLDPGVTEMVLVMGAQTGKTMSLLLGTCLLALFDPGPLIWCLPNDDLAAEIIHQRLLPLMRHNPELARLLPSARYPASAERLPLSTMSLYWTGATTPSKLSSRPAGFIVMDEAAKYAHRHRSEAPPYLLLQERAKAFARRLVVQASTPNTVDSAFWHSYLASDQRKYFVPCPYCGAMQTLRFSRSSVQWDPVEDLTEDHILRTTVYICEACQARISPDKKQAMLAAGEWRITNPAAPSSRRGYHLNSLYSAFVSWGAVAAKFWQSTQDAAPAYALQNFRNSWEAEPWEPYVQDIREDAIRALVDTSYRRGELPLPDPCYVVTSYDPGQSATHWTSVAVYPGGVMYVLDWGTLASYYTDPASGLLGPREHIDTLSYSGRRPAFGYIDSGDFTSHIYAECAASRGVLRPTKGTDVRYGAWGRSKIKGYRGVYLTTYSDHVAKNDLYGRIIGGQTGELHLPADADGELIAGLSGQKLMERGHHWAWKPVAGDHYGDTIKLSRVSWWVHKDEYSRRS